MEKSQNRFLKWVLGVERYSLEYTVKEELGRALLKGRAGMRACCERKLERGGGGELVRECWKKISGR